MKDRIFERALKFVQKMHKGQFRAGKVPVWQHLLRVSETLAHVLSHTKEGTQAKGALPGDAMQALCLALAGLIVQTSKEGSTENVLRACTEAIADIVRKRAS